MRRLRKYLSNVLIALDITLNVALRGHFTTLSARAHTARRAGRRWGILLANALDALIPGHCERAVRADIERALTIINELSV
jgi:hypothetical protein